MGQSQCRPRTVILSTPAAHKALRLKGYRGYFCLTVLYAPPPCISHNCFSTYITAVRGATGAREKEMQEEEERGRGKRRKTLRRIRGRELEDEGVRDRRVWWREGAEGTDFIAMSCFVYVRGRERKLWLL